ncbi:MAG: histidinol-phosphate transaminase [Desulfohalobiaceae bacterium]|nr:histidinol-phosphate transaminase [Desulfohalobiaceae bacterium]
MSTLRHPKVQPQVLDFTPYEAGLSIEEIKSAYNLSWIVKLASNENPLGISPYVRKVVAQSASFGFRYPRQGNPDLCLALADFYGLAPENFLVSNGSDEAIDLLLRVMARPGKDNVLVFDPCFSMYRLQARLCGLKVRSVPLNRDFSFPFEQLLKTADQDTALVFVTNPDNPSGYAAPKEQLLEVAAGLPEDCLLVLDEAYCEFADAPGAISPIRELSALKNLVILRTFSKLYGLAGLRLGYGIMPAWLREYLLRVKPPFSVNLLAEQAGLAALRDGFFAEKTLNTVHAGKSYLGRELEDIGCTVFPSQANFLMFKPPVPAKSLHERLLQQGIIIRPLAGYGLEDYLRVSIGNSSENKAFIRATRDIVSQG